MAEDDRLSPFEPIDDDMPDASVEASTKMVQSTLSRHGFTCPKQFHGLLIRTPSPVETDSESDFSGSNYMSSDEEDDFDDFPIETEELEVDYDEAVEMHRTSNHLLDKSRDIGSVAGKAVRQKVLELHRGLAKAAEDFRDAHTKAGKELEVLIPKLAGTMRWETCLDIMKLGDYWQGRAIERKTEQYSNGFLDVPAYITFLEKTFAKEARMSPDDYNTLPQVRFEALFRLCAPIWKTKHALLVVLQLVATVLYKGEGRMCGRTWAQRVCDAYIRKMIRAGFGEGIEPEDAYLIWHKNTDVCEAFRYLVTQWRAKDCTKCFCTELCFHRVHAELLSLLHVKARASIRHKASLVSQWMALPPEMENLIYSSLLEAEDVPMLDIAAPTTSSTQAPSSDYSMPYFLQTLHEHKTVLNEEWRCARTMDGVATIALPHSYFPSWVDDLYEEIRV